jgi:hypothetical protein
LILSGELLVSDFPTEGRATRLFDQRFRLVLGIDPPLAFKQERIKVKTEFDLF